MAPHDATCRALQHTRQVPAANSARPTKLVVRFGHSAVMSWPPGASNQANTLAGTRQIGQQRVTVVRCNTSFCCGTLYSASLPWCPQSGKCSANGRQLWPIGLLVCLHGRFPVSSPYQPGFRRELCVTSPSR